MNGADPRCGCGCAIVEYGHSLHAGRWIRLWRCLSCRARVPLAVPGDWEHEDPTWWTWAEAIARTAVRAHNE